MRSRLLALALALLAAAPQGADGKKRRKHRRPEAPAPTSEEIMPTGELLEPVAQLYLKERRYEEAIKLYTELIAEHPDRPDLHEARIAACQASPPCAPRRLPFLLEARQRFPGHPDFAEALYEERLQTGQARLADEEAADRARRRPEDTGAQLLLLQSLGRRGQVYERARHAERLGEALAAAVRARPQDPAAWVRYGRYRLEMDDLKGAADATRRALDLSARHDPEALDLDGRIRAARAEQRDEFERDVDRQDLAQDLLWSRED